MSDDKESGSIPTARPEADAPGLGRLLGQNKKWWIPPLVLILVLSLLLLVLHNRATVPFIYELF